MMSLFKITYRKDNDEYTFYRKNVVAETIKDAIDIFYEHYNDGEEIMNVKYMEKSGIILVQNN